MASIIGGEKYGVAKRVDLVAVRVFDCADDGSNESRIVNALDWVIGTAARPAVINMSVEYRCLNGTTQIECAPDTRRASRDAQLRAIGVGIPVIAAAGNAGKDTCRYNPAGWLPELITVASSGQDNGADVAAPMSNWGTCVDIYAPGTSVTSARHTSRNAFGVSSGTSPATAHVTGAVAVLLSTGRFDQVPRGTLVREVTRQLLAVMATPDLIRDVPAGTPNLLLYSVAGMAPGGSPVALAPYADGRLAVVGANADTVMFYRPQSGRNTDSWGQWFRSTTKRWFSVAAESDAATDGRIDLLELTTDGQIWHRRQKAPNVDEWITLAKVSGPPAESIALARQGDGRLVAFATTRQGEVFFSVQRAPRSAEWTAWRRHHTGEPTNLLYSVAAEADANGLITVIGLDRRGNPWRSTQTAPNADSWSEFVSAGGSGPTMEAAALARNADGRLEAFGSAGKAGVWSSTQTDARTWTEWAQLPPKHMRHLAAETQPDGHIRVIGVDQNGGIWQVVQTGAGTYGSWTLIDGRFRV